MCNKRKKKRDNVRERKKEIKKERKREFGDIRIIAKLKQFFRLQICLSFVIGILAEAKHRSYFQ